MRITILPSARQHGVTDTEIRTVLAHPAITLRITARREGSILRAHVGPADINEPYIELIADYAIEDETIVFHAMMLRPTFAANLGIAHLLPHNIYTAQRK